MPESLTGDPHTDQLVPVVQRLVGALREVDPAGVDRAFADAGRLLTGALNEVDHVRTARCLAIVAAAMVPVDQTAGQLLAWWPAHAEYRRLVDRGVSSGIARQLVDIGEAV